MVSLEIDRLASIVVDCGFHIHANLGPGLLESAYEMILYEKLKQKGLSTDRQAPININYDGIQIDAAFKVDLIVEGILIVELKASEQMLPLHSKQLLTYLRLTNRPLGLLMNFGLETMRDGIRRVANNYKP